MNSAVDERIEREKRFNNETQLMIHDQGNLEKRIFETEEAIRSQIQKIDASKVTQATELTEVSVIIRQYT